MEREREELLHMHLDRDENNIAHLAAESGNTVIFKVSRDWRHFWQEILICFILSHIGSDSQDSKAKCV